jgi:gamma-glutamyl hercynylcysteine S-oxide synthase
MTQSSLSLQYNSPVFNRSKYIKDLLEVRRRTAAIFAIATDDAYYTRPIALRNPLVFYEGHIPAFAINVLCKIALGKPGIDDRLEVLFARGIDPDDEASVPNAASLWPDRDEVKSYVERANALVLDAVTNCDLERTDGPWRNLEPLRNIFEHELMHQETFLYMLHQLPLAQKRTIAPFTKSAADAGQRPAGLQAGRLRSTDRLRSVRIPAGRATLGRTRESFGWDNEYEEHTVDVEPFEIDVHSVTNGDFLTFVEAGGYDRQELWSDAAWQWVRSNNLSHPRFWERREDGEWFRIGQFSVDPLPLDAPVYVTHAEASAFAKWKGERLPTEAEYHRAAFSTPDGGEQLFPWGDDLPRLEHGNFGFQNWDPVAIGSYPAGASAWGVHDLVGNGWEWTSSVFAPFPGFEPMPTYKEYSADFFDDKHYVLKGASPVTAAPLVRRSFRNWFRDTYPFVYAKFRCVSATR